MATQYSNSITNNNTKKNESIDVLKDVRVKLPIEIYGAVTVSLPLFSLIFCFVTAVIFQHEEVTETECHVSYMSDTLKHVYNYNGLFFLNI